MGIVFAFFLLFQDGITGRNESKNFSSLHFLQIPLLLPLFGISSIQW